MKDKNNIIISSKILFNRFLNKVAESEIQRK